MTNHWNDIDNASMVLVFGANPAENHPACMAHVNAARYGSKNAQMVVIDPRKTRTACQTENKSGDFYVRIRPGTDIAFINGVIRWLMNSASTYNATWAANMVAWHNGTATNSLSGARAFIDDIGTSRTLSAAECNGAGYDGSASRPLTGGYPKYCDTRFKVNTAGDDYQRGVLRSASYGGGSAWQFSNFPVIAADTSDPNCVWQQLKAHVEPYNTTVVSNICGCTTTEIENVAKVMLKHSRFASSDFGAATSTPNAATYRVTTILYAMGQTQHTTGSQNIKGLAELQTLLGNMGRAGGGINALRGIHNVQGSTDMGNLFDSIPAYSGNPGVNQTWAGYLDPLFGNRLQQVAKVATKTIGTGDAAVTYTANTAGAAGNTITVAYTAGAPSTPTTTATFVAPAIAVTLATDGVGAIIATANDVKAAVDLVAGGPTGVTTAVGGSGAGVVVAVVATPLAGGVDAFDRTTTTASMGLQQRGFQNMTQEWFGNGSCSGADVAALYDCWPKGNGVQHIEAFRLMSGAGTAYLQIGTGTDYVKYEANTPGFAGNSITVAHVLGAAGTLTTTAALVGSAITVTLASVDGLVPDPANATVVQVATAVNGVASVPVTATATGTGTAIVKAATALAYGGDKITAAVVWGQNPAVTEPNQTAVRAGLKELDLLVVTDMFETETAACDRKAGGITYLIPACAHTEEAGSVTNSGRWLQWRERANAPRGNAKADLELLLRFAKALDDAGCFSHIATKWASLGTPIVPAVAGKIYTEVYSKYGWTPDGVPGSFEAVSATSERWAPGASAVSSATLVGSEIVAENVYKEIARPLNALANGTASTTTGGTMWIYSGSDAGATAGVGGYNGGASWNLDVMPGAFGAAWTCHNRAKSRNNVNNGGANTFSRWGWSWLLNRRVFYNNGEVPGDQSDTFVSPGLVCCLFTINTNTAAGFSGVYRAYKTFKDKPSVTYSGSADYNTSSPHFLSGTRTLAGRFSAHTEPYESPASASIKADWGKNTSGGSSLVPTHAYGTTIATPIGDSVTYPLVLTTIRCVEHFQGGPITRNNSYNVEVEPQPWIEINSVDAATYGITDGQMVNVITARSNSTTDETGRTIYTADPTNPADTFGTGFKARVQTGLQSNQRVGVGVVAIPWHWGDRGLSTGSRANDLCIDAWDANTMIPEYKACLCRIQPA